MARRPASRLGCGIRRTLHRGFGAQRTGVKAGAGGTKAIAVVSRRSQRQQRLEGPWNPLRSMLLFASVFTTLANSAALPFFWRVKPTIDFDAATRLKISKKHRTKCIPGLLWSRSRRWLRLGSKCSVAAQRPTAAARVESWGQAVG